LQAKCNFYLKVCDQDFCKGVAGCFGWVGLGKKSEERLELLT